ncbi:MAG: YARHG domain-containing protein [Deltaproteobacteria bacterium]|nr:YARHG domain-containing protein [Deltaproteobacteria bacterium]
MRWSRCVAAWLLVWLCGPIPARARPRAVEICTAGERGDLKVLERELDDSALSTCTKSELRLLRNAIFARHGFCFRSRELRAHFGRFDWYRPDPKANARLEGGQGLGELEQRNLERIQRAERGEAPAWMRPPDLCGKRLIRVEASSEDVYHFCPGGRVILHHSISEIRDDREFGRWRWQSDALELHFVRATGGKPKGEPLHCASVCEYADYEPFDKPIDRRERIPRAEIEQGRPWRIEHTGAQCPEGSAR